MCNGRGWVKSYFSPSSEEQAPPRRPPPPGPSPPLACSPVLAPLPSWVSLPRRRGLDSGSLRPTLRFSSSSSSEPPDASLKPSGVQTCPRRPRSPARGRAHGHARPHTHAHLDARARAPPRPGPLTPPRPAPPPACTPGSRAARRGGSPARRLAGARASRRPAPTPWAEPVGAQGLSAARLGAHGQARARAHAGADTRGHPRAGHALPRRRRSPLGKSRGPRALPGSFAGGGGGDGGSGLTRLFRRRRDRWGVGRREARLIVARVLGRRARPGRRERSGDPRNRRGPGKLTAGASSGTPRKRLFVVVWNRNKARIKAHAWLKVETRCGLGCHCRVGPSVRGVALRRRSHRAFLNLGLVSSLHFCLCLFTF